MKHILTVKDLFVRRSSTFDLAIPNLHIKPKEILCVTGTNGSGKTTLLECMTGLLMAERGYIRLEGHDISHNVRFTKARIGYIPDDENWLIPQLCAKEYFELLQRIYTEAGVTTDMQITCRRLTAALKFKDVFVQLGSLSHGNKKKVQIIAALMHQPSLVILDELRNGLDPFAIIAAEEIMQLEAARGATIVASTHDLWWAERIADTILLLEHGKPVIHANKNTLVRQYGSIEALFRHTLQHKRTPDASL